MSDRYLDDIHARQEMILARIIRMQRYWLLALAIIGGISAFPALPFLFSNPDYPRYDSIMQLANGVILLVAAAALLVLPLERTRQIALVAFTLVMADLSVRAILAHHMPLTSSGMSREAVMLQFSPMIPAMLVGSFLFLKYRQAAILCWSLTCVTACSVMIYQLRAGSEAWSDYHRLSVVLQFLFAHPVIVLLMTLIARVNKKFQEYSEFLVERENYIANHLLRDHSGKLLTHAAMLEHLRSRLEQLQFEGRVMRIRIRINEKQSEYTVPEMRKKLIQILDTVLAKPVEYGLVESDHILVSQMGQGDFSEEDTQVQKAWHSLVHDTDLNINTILLQPGMTLNILKQDLELDTSD